MARHTGVLQACDDERLFNVKLWPRQRELLAAVERGPRTHVQMLGRRSGKSLMAALVALHSSLFRPDLDAMVRPGETRFAVVVATNLSQARLLIRMAQSVIENSPILAPMLASATEDELRFEPAPGVRTCVRAMPCSSRGIRGYPVSVAILDELSHFSSEGEVGNVSTAERVFTALAPAVAQFGEHGRLLLISTPYGNENLLAKMYYRAVTGELADTAAVRAPSWEMNPTLTKEVLAFEEARDPDDYRQAFGAEPLSPGDAYLNFDRIQIADRPPLPADALAGPIVAGIDPSFANDPFGVVIVGHDRERPDRLVVARAEAIGGRNREFEATMIEVIDLLKQYNVTSVVTDQYSSAAVQDRLARAGFFASVLTFTAQSKTAAYSEVRSRLYGDGQEIYGREPGGPELIAELRRLRTRFSVGSAAVYSPRVAGSHGDLASALAVVTFDQRHGPADSGWIQESYGHTMMAGMAKGAL